MLEGSVEREPGVAMETANRPGSVRRRFSRRQVQDFLAGSGVRRASVKRPVLPERLKTMLRSVRTGFGKAQERSTYATISRSIGPGSVTGENESPLRVRHESAASRSSAPSDIRVPFWLSGPLPTRDHFAARYAPGGNLTMSLATTAHREISAADQVVTYFLDLIQVHGETGRTVAVVFLFLVCRLQVLVLAIREPIARRARAFSFPALGRNVR